MPDYLRPRVSGATIFFTVALAERGSDLLVREVGRLRDAVQATQTARPFGIDAWVICRIIFIASGRCRKGTRSSRCGGG